MPRRVQDIVPASRRTPPGKRPATEDIKKPSVIREEIRRAEEKRSEVSVKRMTFTPPTHRKTRSSGRFSGRKSFKFLGALGIIVVVIGLGYVLSTYFSRATFRLVPKSVPIVVDNTYVAEATSTKNVLTYQLITLTGSETAVVPASDGQVISTKAQGKVTLYNAYGTTSQRLVAGTRIANDSGRVYRLTGSLVVPGYTMSGTNKISGTVTAAVVADAAGDSYNILKSDPQSDFRIVAYKGTPKYDGFYGRVTSDIIGGFSGTRKTVASSVMASTTSVLHARIAANLLAKAKGSVPAGSIMYDDAFVIGFDPATVRGNDPSKATVSVQGTLSAVIFNRESLKNRIIGDKAISVFGTALYTSPGLDLLRLSIANPKDFSPTKKNTLIFKLKGDMKLVGTIPTEQIKNEVAGLALSDTENILRKHATVIDIPKSDGEVVPPWAKVPTDIGRITVTVGD